MEQLLWKIMIRWTISVLVGVTIMVGMVLFHFHQPENGTNAETGSGDVLLSVLTESVDTSSYKTVVPGRRMIFPDDHGAHPDYRQEWWYFTGRLESTTGRVFGYQLTFFRFGSKSSISRPDSAWVSDQIWMAHLTLTDPDGKRFIAEEDFARGELGLAGAEIDPFSVWINGWSVTSEKDESICIDCFAARLQARTEEFTLDLMLETAFPPVLQGEEGYSVKNREGSAASYYYSMPGLKSAGTVRLGEESYSVEGESWMDREWSTSVLSSGQSGWDWFSLNLDNDYRLVIFQIREEGKSPFRYGLLLDPENKGAMLNADHIHLTAKRTWTNPRQDAEYPVEWKMWGDSPIGTWSLTVSPVMDNQELDLMFRYFEGLVNITGVWNEEPVTGWGYMELTGY